MTWGITRIMLFSLAFLFGTLITRTLDPKWNAGAMVTETTELSTSSGSTLVVTCDSGNPIVEQVAGTEGALKVKCAASQMRVVRSRRQRIPNPVQSLKRVPASPVAAGIVRSRTHNNAE
jgi:hypothetical protein